MIDVALLGGGYLVTCIGRGQGADCTAGSGVRTLLMSAMTDGRTYTHTSPRRDVGLRSKRAMNDDGRKARCQKFGHLNHC